MRVLVRFATMSLGMGCVAACAPREPNPSKTAQHLSDAVDYRPGDLTILSTTLSQQRSAIEQAYLRAQGPGDFERRLNAALPPSQFPISIAVHDLEEPRQIVSGYYDANANGFAEPNEVQFELVRRVQSVKGHLRPETSDPSSEP